MEYNLLNQLIDGIAVKPFNIAVLLEKRNKRIVLLPGFFELKKTLIHLLDFRFLRCDLSLIALPKTDIFLSPE